jgi:hypothetical protein
VVKWQSLTHSLTHSLKALIMHSCTSHIILTLHHFWMGTCNCSNICIHSLIIVRKSVHIVHYCKTNKTWPVYPSTRICQFDPNIPPFKYTMFLPYLYLCYQSNLSYYLKNLFFQMKDIDGWRVLQIRSSLLCICSVWLWPFKSLLFIFLFRSYLYSISIPTCIFLSLINSHSL